MNASNIQPRHQAPPAGWDAQTFEALTDAVASALVATYRRTLERNEEPTVASR